METSGTFHTKDERLVNTKGFIGRPFQYEGVVHEGNKGYEVRATVYVVTVQGDLYKLEASTEPVIVEKL